MFAEHAANAGTVVNHTNLLQRVWNPAYAGGSGPACTIAKNFRNKLGADADKTTYIYNEHGFEYRLGQGRLIMMGWSGGYCKGGRSGFPVGMFMSD